MSEVPKPEPSILHQPVGEKAATILWVFDWKSCKLHLLPGLSPLPSEVSPGYVGLPRVAGPQMHASSSILLPGEPLLAI